MTDQNSILKGRSPQSEPNEKNKLKIHDLTRPGSNLRPIACEANDVPLHHSGEASVAENTERRRGVYLRRKLASLKIPTTNNHW